MPVIKKLFYFVSLFILYLTFSPTNAPIVQAADFLTPANETLLSHHGVRQNIKQVKNVKYDKEKLKFIVSPDSTLHLMSRDGKNDYLSFINYAGRQEFTGYSVREIRTSNPNQTFFEINAENWKGAHHNNTGYWLIGKHKGQWVTYVSLDNLASMGYTLGKWHQIRTEVNEDGTGRFILTSRHIYMPPGAIYGSERRLVPDLRLEFFWDEDAQWFGMRKLPL